MHDNVWHLAVFFEDNPEAVEILPIKERMLFFACRLRRSATVRRESWAKLLHDGLNQRVLTARRQPKLKSFLYAQR
jgi:hypothetical protein